MREIKQPERVIKGSVEYRRSTPPAKEPSPLRGLKQRWAVGSTGSAFLFRTRANAMGFYKQMPVEMRALVGLPHRVFV